MKFRKIVNAVVLPMSLLGLNSLRDDTFTNCYLRLILSCTAFVYCAGGTFLYSIQHSDFYDIIIPVTFFMVAMRLIFVVLYLQVHKPVLSSILLDFNHGVFLYPDERSFNLNYGGFLSDRVYEKLPMLVLFIEISGVAFICSSPFVGYILVGKLRAFTYPQWTPWEVDSFLMYAVTYLSQIPASIFVFLTYFMIQMYFTFSLAEFLRHGKKLQFTIQTLDIRTRKQIEDQNFNSILIRGNVYTENYNRVFATNLRMCVGHHRKLRELFRKFKIFFEIEFSMELFVVTVVCGLLLYCLVEETDPEHFMSLFGALWFLVSNLFFRCLIGEQFSTLNLRIRNSIFHELNWTEQSLENRKSISIFHLHASRAFSLKGFKIFDSSYFVFLSIIRLSYSYFNLIRLSTSSRHQSQ